MSGGTWKRGALVTAVAAAALTSASVAIGRPAQREHIQALSSLEAGLLADVNSVRRQHGLVPLKPSVPLGAAARQHSQSMAMDGFFSHDSEDGSSFDKRLQRFYPEPRVGYWSVGENILWASPTIEPDNAIQAWMNSPPHRENLLTARWREIGIAAVHVDSAPGIYENEPVTVITTDFGVRR